MSTLPSIRPALPRPVSASAILGAARERPPTILPPTFAIVGLLTLAACSSGSGNGTGGGATTTKTGTGGGTTTPTTTGSGGGGGAVCLPSMKYGGGETTTTSNSVTAKIVDETGAPIAAGQPVYICGINLCSPTAKTDAMGMVTISTNLSLMKAAFKVGDTIGYAELGIPLTMPTTDFTMGGTKVINTANFTGKPGAPLNPGADAVSGDVTITIPKGASVAFDTITYETADSQMFRAVSIPIANEGPWLASAGVTGFELLYGVSPTGVLATTICPAASVTVALPHAQMTPNDLGWAPGTAVEFWVTTTLTEQTFAPYAGWAKASTGAVSSDGKSVSTTAGEGFIFLGHFAIRKAS